MSASLQVCGKASDTGIRDLVACYALMWVILSPMSLCIYVNHVFHITYATCVVCVICAIRTINPNCMDDTSGPFNTV